MYLPNLKKTETETKTTTTRKKDAAAATHTHTRASLSRAAQYFFFLFFFATRGEEGGKRGAPGGVQGEQEELVSLHSRLAAGLARGKIVSGPREGVQQQFSPT